MTNGAALGLALMIVCLVALDLILDLGGTLAISRWFFGVVDWLAFWRYL